MAAGPRAADRAMLGLCRRMLLSPARHAPSRLPSTRTAELGSARSSVVTVFEQLAAEGYIAARPGFGYFAPAAAIDSDDADRIG
jgi:DNA-binding transcriptional MocR family regulator